MKRVTLLICFSMLSVSAEVKKDIATLKAAALKIDQAVASFYKAKNLNVPAVTDDATFLRRSFLVTSGRIPTAEEARSFIEISDPNKREELISYLANSKGYSSHMANWAYDLLRVADERATIRGTSEPYRYWIRTAMTNDMPWDDFVNALLTSSGDGWDQSTAAVGYYTRDRGMPLDNLANTMRVFLGSRMECAQCHDDPYGKTERHDFYELAAFTHGQYSYGEEIFKPLYDELNSNRDKNRPVYNTARMLWDEVYGLSFMGGGEGRIELPEDYQYKDAQPGEMVGAKTPFGKGVRISEKKASNDGRKQMAEWMITKTGEQFPSVIANRMWKRVMGKGFYEPVDEFIPASKTQSPELMQHLVNTMIALDYDLRAFQEVLLLTKTFQFATNPNSSIVEGGDDFHGRKISRLSSEQIWDSLITLVDGDPDKKKPKSLDDRIYYNKRPVLVGKKTMTQLSKEVLALKSEAEVRAYFDALHKEITSNGGKSASDDSMMMMTSTTNYGKTAMVRASELPSPAPRDHLLYLFGQSNRDVVEASSREPNVGQVLSLMNGFVQENLINNPKAYLYKSLDGAKSDQEKIRRIYIAILNRPPSKDEMELMMAEMAKSPNTGIKNIISALVMSSEFLFLQ